MSEIFQSNESAEENWMSVSDLMAGLMIVFLFVAIAFIKGVGQEQRRLEQSICTELQQAMEDATWRDQVEICDDEIVVKFKDPDALFDLNKATLKPKFRSMLSDFFPKYMSVIGRYSVEIDEVRIEGHTDDTGLRSHNTKLEKYFYNMGLSQRRTRSVMEYVFQTQAAEDNETWLISHMTANGLSSSTPVFQKDGKRLDRKGSRRVEFRIRLKTPRRLREIAEAFNAT